MTVLLYTHELKINSDMRKIIIGQFIECIYNSFDSSFRFKTIPKTTIGGKLARVIL